MKQTEETRRVALQIKQYLAKKNWSRDELVKRTKLGKSTVDKLMSGLYTDSTLMKLVERTDFIQSQEKAADHLGAYSKSAWKGYLADFLFLRPSFVTEGAIVASRIAIEWDEAIPGLVMIEKDAKKRSVFGVLAIPQERSPLIYVNYSEAPWVGRHLILSIMLGAPVMRGAMMTVTNVIAHAFTPVMAPVVFRRLDHGPSVDAWGTIPEGHPAHSLYRAELDQVIAKQFARAIFSPAQSVSRRKLPK